MPSIVKRILKGKAAYWARDPQPVSNSGRYRYAAPVIVKCRYDHGPEIKIDLEGVMQTVQSVVYVDFEVKVGDVFKEMDHTQADGVLLASLLDVDIELANHDANEVLQYASVEDIKYRSGRTLRVAVL